MLAAEGTGWVAAIYICIYTQDYLSIHPFPSLLSSEGSLTLQKPFWTHPPNLRSVSQDLSYAHNTTHSAQMYPSPQPLPADNPLYSLEYERGGPGCGGGGCDMRGVVLLGRCVLGVRRKMDLLVRPVLSCLVSACHQDLAQHHTRGAS